MRQLDTCDFCGDAPEGVFEVVPGDIDGGPVRLALCANCRDTLASVTDPLLDADTNPETTDTADTAEEQSASDAGDDTTGEPTDSDDDFEPATADADADDDDTEAAADAGDEEGVTIEEQGGGTPARRPDGYAQLLRLLQNRDGAMPRSDLRALATNAYDLTEDTFEAAIEAAVANGDVEETRKGLRTT
jgi:hypothetical protein